MANEYSQNLGLDLVPLSKDPENLGDLYRLYNACKLIMGAVDSYTGILGAPNSDWSTIGADFITVQNQTRHYAQASVAISSGQICGLNSSGQIILAIAGQAVGWAPFAISSGAYGELRLIGIHKAVSGLVPGTSYYSSTGTPGAITSTVTAQKLGIAVLTNRLFFNPN